MIPLISGSARTSSKLASRAPSAWASGTGDLGSGIDQGDQVEAGIGGGVAGVDRPHPARAQLRHLDHAPSLPDRRLSGPRSILL
jgi:hypothetical protein